MSTKKKPFIKMMKGFFTFSSYRMASRISLFVDISSCPDINDIDKQFILYHPKKPLCNSLFAFGKYHHRF